MYLYYLINSFGYCSSVLPRESERDITYNYNSSVGLFIPHFKEGFDNNKVRSVIRFNTYSYSSLNWIYDAFYLKGNKIIPPFIENDLTPLTLALGFMDDGYYIKNRGVKFATHSFTFFYLNRKTKRKKRLYS